MNEKTIEKAIRVMKNAYNPYSHYAVGCVLIADSGKEYVGCNVENASYGATLCAERVALGNAISQGERKFEEIVLVSSGESLPIPCGICRQMLSEFGDMRVLAINNLGDRQSCMLSELLPMAFKLEK